MKRLLVFGDSVMWGQGLRAEQKLDALIETHLRDELGEAIERTSYAHSGAITWPSTHQDTRAVVLTRHIQPMPPPPPEITDALVDAAGGVAASTDADERARIGEIPGDWPVIAAQVRAARTKVAGPVDVVLLNGGINDVGVLNIMLPWMKPSQLQTRTRGYAGYMKALLGYVHQAFPTAQVFVFGYFPIVSAQTNLSHFFELSKKLLERAQADLPAHAALAARWDALKMAEATFAEEGRALHDQLDVLSPARVLLQRLSRTFRDGIDDVLAVDVAAAGGYAHFVRLPWQDSFSVLAPEARLWGPTVDLTPPDPVAAQRRAMCVEAPKNPVEQFVCEHASYGHPNVLGAQLFAEAFADVAKDVLGR